MCDERCPPLDLGASVDGEVFQISTNCFVAELTCPVALPMTLTLTRYASMGRSYRKKMLDRFLSTYSIPQLS